MIVGLFVLYEGLRLAIAGSVEARAIQNALAVLEFETRTALAFEQAVQVAVAAHDPLMTVLNFFYVWTHFFVTLALLILLFLRHYDGYRTARNLLVGVTGMGFLMHWLYPLAPPRLLPSAGIADTLAAGGSGFHYGEGVLSNLLNEYAAMPSLHVAWAFVVAVVAYPLARPWLRPFVLAYPTIMVVAVVATGNHWVLDAIVGAALIPVGAVLSVGVERAWRLGVLHRRPRTSRGRPTEAEAGAPVPLRSERND